MSIHNICFCGEVRKILCGYPSYRKLLEMKKKKTPDTLCTLWYLELWLLAHARQRWRMSCTDFLPSFCHHPFKWHLKLLQIFYRWSWWLQSGCYYRNAKSLWTRDTQFSWTQSGTLFLWSQTGLIFILHIYMQFGIVTKELSINILYKKRWRNK